MPLSLSAAPTTTQTVPPGSPSGWTPQDEADFQSILKAHNYTPPPTSTASGGTGNDWYSTFKQAQQQQHVSQTDVGTLAGENTTQEIKGGVSKIAEAQKEVATPSANPLENAKTGLEAGLHTAAGAVETATSPITGFISALMQKANAKGPSITGKEITDSGQGNTGLMDSIKAMAQAHPELARNLSDLFTVATAPLGVEGVGESVANAVSKQGLKDAGTGIKNSVKDIIAGNEKFDAKVAESNTPEAKKAQEISKLQETISPKLTSPEVKSAIAQGRVTRGKDSLIFGKQPDLVTQSQEVQKAAQTVHENIPNASKMDDTQLYTALDNKTDEMATGLSEEMQKVSVKPETSTKVVDTWNDLKVSQESEPEFDGFAGSGKFQKKFENYLKQVKGEDTTLDDVWQARKDYDASIPTNVKNANNASHPNLQFQKTMWLQNRAILNSAIHDVSTGLGGVSQKAFSDMSDMYLSKENLLSKAKIDSKGLEGILPRNKKEWTRWGISVGGGIIGLDVLRKEFGF